jgi:hypothetical protein
MINYICDAFGFGLTQIAEIFQVPRQDMIKWMYNPRLEPEHRDKMQYLSLVAKEIHSLKIKDMFLYLEKPMLKESTLMDKLKLLSSLEDMEELIDNIRKLKG